MQKVPPHPRPAPAPTLCGAVLAGGRSTRMRRAKARIVVDGQPLWRRQRLLLAGLGAKPVCVVLRPRQRSLGAAHEIRDFARDAGPLAGVAAALRAAPADLVAVVAVDLPALRPEWFRRLLSRCGRARGAVFRGPRGYEPLAAIYPAAAAAVAEVRLSQGRLRLQDFAGDLVRRRLVASVPLPPELADQAANWNRPGEWSPLTPPPAPGRKSPRR